MRIRTLSIFAVLVLVGTAAIADEGNPPTPTPDASAPTASAPESPAHINDRFIDPDVDPAMWAKRWESESREVYVARRQIASAVRLTPGMSVADVGAGTGLFTQIFAEEVGSNGIVYARDIAPRFIDYLEDQARKTGFRQVDAKVSKADSAELPDASVDVAFVCDTYHHFEHPEAMLRSMRRALKPGGTLVIVDFERIEGKSREWVLGHVRAGKEQVIGEIQSAGFKLVEEVAIPELHENYCLRFHKVGDEHDAGNPRTP